MLRNFGNFVPSNTTHRQYLAAHVLSRDATRQRTHCAGHLSCEAHRSFCTSPQPTRQRASLPSHRCLSTQVTIAFRHNYCGVRVSTQASGGCPCDKGNATTSEERKRSPVGILEADYLPVGCKAESLGNRSYWLFNMEEGRPVEMWIWRVH